MKKHKCTKHLLGELANELHRKPFEIVRLDELVQVHTQKFARYAKMPTEVEALCESQNTMFAFGVLQYTVSLDMSLKEYCIQLTHSFNFCRMFTSTNAC